MYCRPGGASNRLSLLPRAFPSVARASSFSLLSSQFSLPWRDTYSIDDGVPCGNALGQFPPADSAVDQALESLSEARSSNSIDRALMQVISLIDPLSKI